MVGAGHWQTMFGLGGEHSQQQKMAAPFPSIHEMFVWVASTPRKRQTLFVEQKMFTFVENYDIGCYFINGNKIKY